MSLRGTLKYWSWPENRSFEISYHKFHDCTDGKVRRELEIIIAHRSFLIGPL